MDVARLKPDRDERIARNLAALDRLEAPGERLAREQAWGADAADAVTAVREERDRDDR